MRNIKIFALGVTLAACGLFAAPTGVNAAPVSLGASLANAVNSNPMIEQVQVRRRLPLRRRSRGGISPGAAFGAAAAIGLVGAAIIANEQRQNREERQRAQRQQYYYGGYGAQPACYLDTQPVYDGYGNFRGNQQVQVCR